MNQRELKEVELNNVSVKEMTSKSGNTYYIIFDNDGEQNNNAYFCFRGSDNLKHEDFERLRAEADHIISIQLTYFENEFNGRINKKVVSFKLPETDEIF